MTSIQTTTPATQRIKRFQSLQAGQYWRAKVSASETGVDEGEVLLIQSLRWVEDAVHTVILRPHPSKYGKRVTLASHDERGTLRHHGVVLTEHRYLLNDFLACFEHEPNHQQVRQAEVQAVHEQVAALQSELLQAQSDPALLARVVDEALAQEIGAPGSGTVAELVPAQGTMANLATGTVSNAIGTGITERGIEALKAAASREHQVATIKAQWIQGKTSQIGETIKALTPFYEEQAAAALAQTEDVRTYVAKLVKGIESLDLYVGKAVQVDRIREGVSAPRDVPLTFVQKKLLMDEELALWLDVDEWFDFSDEHRFFDALRKHDGLVKQIFPTERCVLVMAVTRRDIDYGDALTNVNRNEENKKVFLLVRDGMNLFRVLSPVEGHLRTHRLFPTRDEHDQIFRGFDGSYIKFEDVAYTDKLSVHEESALHYKRLLLLCCGLDHREKLFGDFYEGAADLSFMSLAFQAQYCRYLHDDDASRLLPGQVHTPLAEWIAEKNAYLTTSSRVLCNWRDLMNPHTAPAACKYERGGERFHRPYKPAEEMGVALVYRDGKDLCVDVEVSGHTAYAYEARAFKCKVNLSRFKNGQWAYSEMPYLCLDAVDIQEVHHYLHHRCTRENHLFYIRFLKHALAELTIDREAERETRNAMLAALQEGNVAHGTLAEKLIDQAIRAWRAANRGKALPTNGFEEAPGQWKALLDQMYLLAGNGGDGRIANVETLMRGLSLTPLRLVLTGDAKLVVYAAPAKADQDNRLEPHAWAHRILLRQGKAKLSEQSRKWAIVPSVMAAETVLHAWPECEAWVERSTAFKSPKAKDEALLVCQGTNSSIRELMQGDPERLQREASLWVSRRRAVNAKSRWVQEPWLAIPFGIIKSNAKNVRYLCVAAQAPYALLHGLAQDEALKAEIRDRFVGLYSHKETATNTFSSSLQTQYHWELIEVPAGALKLDTHGYVVDTYSHPTVRTVGSTDPRLSSQFEAWKKAYAKDLEGKMSIWLPEQYLNDAQLNLDEAAGIELPQGYAPVKVVRVETTARHDNKVVRWYDICSIDADDNTLVDSVRFMGYSRMTWTHLTPAAARAFIENAASVRVASEESGDPLPPAGVERWMCRESCA